MHASWLNQVEIYHSIIQRKLLDPNDFDSIAALARALNDFERRYNEIAEPFAGPSPARTSQTSSPASTSANATHRSNSPPDHDRTCGGEH